jgi:hypothetical protein
MPYITPEKRISIDDLISDVEGFITEQKSTFEKPGIEVGEMNYIVSRLLNAYLKNKGINYKSLNDCVGVLECAKLEFFRRLIMPYEEQKKIANGDVYDAQKKT